MGRSRTRWAAATALAGVCLAACSATEEPPSVAHPSAPSQSTSASDEQPASSDTPEPYHSTSFRPALTVDRPGWLPPEPVLDQPHFLTWVGEDADIDRAVRFMSPIGVYAPSAADKKPGKLQPVPKDYVRYLLGLRKDGAEFSDRATVKVDGHRASLVTAATTASLSGVLGCQDTGLSPEDCYGLQPYALIRLAVIDDNDTTVLAWARTLPGSPTRDQDFTAFEALLGTLRFS